MADGSGAAGVTDLMRSIAGVDGRHLPVEGTLNFRDAGGYPQATVVSSPGGRCCGPMRCTGSVRPGSTS